MQKTMCLQTRLVFDFSCIVFDFKVLSYFGNHRLVQEVLEERETEPEQKEVPDLSSKVVDPPNLSSKQRRQRPYYTFQALR